jgi:hypothetical protein
MSDHNAAPMLLFIVHSHVRPIIGNGCHGRGPCSSRPHLRALRVPRARQKYAKGSGAPVLTLQDSGEAEIVPNGVHGSGETEIVPYGAQGSGETKIVP